MVDNITKTLDNFILFINSNWKSFNRNLDDLKFRDDFQKKDITDNWFQFNWELYVELQVCKAGEFLVEYGDGAECSDNGRVTYVNSKPSHLVKCKGKDKSDLVLDYISNKNIKIDDKEFYKFVSFNGRFFDESAPFEYSLLLDDYGENYLVKNKDIAFFLGHV